MLIFGNIIVPHCFKVRLIMLGCFTLSVYSDHSSTVKMVQLFEKYLISWKSLYNFVSVLCKPCAGSHIVLTMMIPVLSRLWVRIMMSILLVWNSVYMINIFFNYVPCSLVRSGVCINYL